MRTIADLQKAMEYVNMDAQQLVDAYRSTLTEFGGHESTEEGVIETLFHFFTECGDKIRRIMKMPGYNGNLQVISSVEVPRIGRTWSDVNTSMAALYKGVFNNGDKLLSKKTKDGKTIEDAIKASVEVLPKAVKIKDLSAFNGKTCVKADVSETFTSDGFTVESVNLKTKANKIYDVIKSYVPMVLDAETAKELNTIEPTLRAAAGMKTTRVVGKWIRMCGLEDQKGSSKYTELYIKGYCELMKDDPEKFMYILSVNPIDYLKMSIFTGGATSCHSILTHGGWHGGTVSYMLDKVTMIGYTLKPHTQKVNEETGEVITATEHPELFGKIHRVCYHWDGERLVQSRVYPQGNDGKVNRYKAFRLATQRLISESNGTDPNKWVFRRDRHRGFCQHCGTNYPDWKYERNNANLSTPGMPGDDYDSVTPMEIGAKPRCIKCGVEFTATGTLYCNEHEPDPYRRNRF